MTLDVPWLVLLGVEETRDTTSSITERDNDGCTDTLLQGSPNVVGAPGDDEGDEGVDTSSGQKETSVLDLSVGRDQKEKETETAQ